MTVGSLSLLREHQSRPSNILRFCCIANRAGSLPCASAMDSGSIYQYTDIEQDGSIRLIRLAPSQHLDAELKCSLIHTTIDECYNDIVRNYIALSYVWGNDIKSCTILVDGKRLPITASLDEALRHIRDTHRVIRIWADGICINQDDIEDRNRQVRQMGSIYSTAHHTVIFLGPSSPECDSLMESLDTQQRRLTRGEERLALDTRERHKFRTYVEEHVNRAWFTRLWVIQELALSTDPWVQCGKRRARWELFSKQILSFQSPKEQAISFQSLIGLNDLRSRFQLSQKADSESGPFIMQLLDVLKSTRGSGASDPRDQIYAILGLIKSKSSKQESIPIDYGLTTVQLYEMLACRHMAYSKDLSILSWIGEPILSKRSSELPSWVPDWTIKQYTKPRTGELEQFSTCIPHILAIVGLNHGSVKAVIAESSWPPRYASIEQLEKPDFKKRMLDWLTTTDPQKQELRQYLCEYYYKHDLSQYLKSTTVTRPEGSTKLSSEYLAVLGPIVSEWFPEPKSQKSSKYKFWDNNAWRHPSLINREASIFLDSLFRYALIPTFAPPSLLNEQLVVLEGGQFVKAPMQTCLGDIVVTLQEKNRLYVLRPHEGQIDTESEQAIRRDLSNKARILLSGYQGEFLINHSYLTMKSYKYVTSCKVSDVKIDYLEGRAYHFGKTVLREAREPPQIFAIH